MNGCYCYTEIYHFLIYCYTELYQNDRSHDRELVFPPPIVVLEICLKKLTGRAQSAVTAKAILRFRRAH